MRGLIKHLDYEIEYFVYGNGEQVLFAFHGFNNHAEDFKILAESFGNRFRIVAINLFFHGDSHAKDNLVETGFSKDDLKNLFLEMASIFPSEKYSLMGYSLGGRIVLKLIEIFPERLDKIILLAPDGIRISLFYKFLTQTRLGSRLLRRVIERPSFFFRLAILLRNSRIVGEKKYQFAIGNFDSLTKRKKVYLVWMTLRKIFSRKSIIKDFVRKHDLHLYLFFGKYDNIIPPQIGKNFQKGMEENITLTVLDSGHKLLKETTIEEIARTLNL